MPQLTIDLPEAIMPVLHRKAEGWKQTPENFLASYVSLCLENDEQTAADPAREALEDILEERDQGPFVTVPDDLVDRVMKKAMTSIQQRQAYV